MSLIDNVNVLHCKTPLVLALVLNYDFSWQCGCAALQNTSYIWHFCWTTSLICYC